VKGGMGVYDQASKFALKTDPSAVIAALGMPFVLAYTATIYWVFRGKVKITPASY